MYAKYVLQMQLLMHTHIHIHPVIQTDGKQIWIANETAALFGKCALSD